jgi:Ca2+-binding RTX toxin-like protein
LAAANGAEGIVQAAGTTFAVSQARLAQTTFTAGTFSSDDLFVNVYDGSAFSGPQNITGGAGSDTLTGGSNDDHISGEAGNDHLIGNNGNDTLNGGTGTDTCTGGAGTNTLKACE